MVLQACFHSGTPLGECQSSRKGLGAPTSPGAPSTAERRPSHPELADPAVWLPGPGGLWWAAFPLGNDRTFLSAEFVLKPQDPQFFSSLLLLIYETERSAWSLKRILPRASRLTEPPQPRGSHLKEGTEPRRLVVCLFTNHTKSCPNSSLLFSERNAF